MNGNQDEFEKEINLVDFFFYCLKKWRGVLIVIMIAAVCAGGYKYLSVVEDNQAKMDLKKLQDKEGNGEAQEEPIMNPHVAAYKFAVENGQRDLEKQRDFIENSVIMQLDASHLQTGTLSFFIDCEAEAGSTLNALVSAYQIYVSDGRLTEKLAEQDSIISQAELQNMVSFSNTVDKDFLQENRKALPVQLSEKLQEQFIEYNSIQLQVPVSDQPVFQIRIVAPNEELCELYMETAKSAILYYSGILRESIADHNLKCMASVQSERIDVNVQNYQKQILIEYVIALRNLDVLRAKMETVQDEEGEYIPSIILGNPIISGAKYAVIGLLIGAIFSIFVLFFFYAMSGRFWSVDSFEKEYGMKLLGRVNLSRGEKKWFGFLDRWIYRMEEGAYANIPSEEQMKIASSNIRAVLLKNESLKKVMIAGTIGRNNMDRVCAQLTEGTENTTFSTYKQIIFSAADLEEMDSFDGILFVEKRGVSVSKLIRQEKELAEGHGVMVLGAIVL